MVMLENLKAKLKATPKWDLHLFLTTEDFIELCVQTLSWALPLFQSMEKWIPGKNGSDGIVVPVFVKVPF